MSSAYTQRWAVYALGVDLVLAFLGEKNASGGLCLGRRAARAFSGFGFLMARCLYTGRSAGLCIFDGSGVIFHEADICVFLFSGVGLYEGLACVRDAACLRADAGM